MNQATLSSTNDRQFTVIQPTNPTQHASKVLVNLLRQTSPSILIALAERYGLPRVPGLDQQALKERLLRHLSEAQLQQLENELITANFGRLSVRALVDLLLEHDAQRAGNTRARSSKPRMDQISADEAILLDGGSLYWSYTMRGHDVTLDLAKQELACDCTYFSYAARRKAVCKHLATAFTLIPQVYAREALIDLMLWREYGATDAQGWAFISTKRTRDAA